MSAAENKKVVLSFFANLSAGHLGAALGLLDEKATWRVSGKPEYIPLAGTYSKQEIAGLVAMVRKAMPGGIRLTVTGSIAEGDRVAVEAEVRGVSPAGKVYDNRIFFAVDVRDGTIRSIREYYDTIHTNEVLFGRIYPSEVLAQK
ncbi:MULTISPECIES: nuclear transport factor 2 family protein [Pseudofrankia]|uniref:nuclear transport factor 2 family protein n=1 Tax=Pseudofrankia TaxID=2994363 RepID=UPI000234CAA7|nr:MULTISPECIES: nuclear transport factor 2 family protein [Pseudofrankia]OHV28727.1 hypothetical protein BCD49_37510 [Pseudofrankia sp. EUN1h]